MLLAGGGGARMAGVDKAGIELGGRTLLEICLDAFVDADEVVVVGLPAPTRRPVTFTREDPPSGGPVAGLLAGAAALRPRPRQIGVLAVDMPRVSARTFVRLREAADGRDGAFLLDPSGRRQLCGVLDPTALARVRPDLGRQHGMPLRALLAGLDLVDVAAVGDEARDIDTWDDLRELEG